MEPVVAILERKKAGLDCTEEESAEVKGYIREQLATLPEMFQEVLKHFPIEWSEI